MDGSGFNELMKEMEKELQKEEAQEQDANVQGAFDSKEIQNKDGKVIQIMGDKSFEVEI